ncbi:MAG: segregation/condensation protein A [Halanaerobiales bacterium]|nr:segregation/condensation protein A [Halanaerobiales bacterium]
MDYEVKLNTFQGPLELLYQLVKKNKIEISEISLAKITGEYLDYIDQQIMNLEFTSEFLVIAAELIEIKARYLLPKTDDQDQEEDEESLVQRLKKYQLYKELSFVLADDFETRRNVFKNTVELKKIKDFEEEVIIDFNLKDLKEIYLKAIYSDNELEIEDIKEVEHIIVEKIKVEKKINYVLDILGHYKQVSFFKLIKDHNNVMEVVVTFLSILELIKANKVKVKQEELFAPIEIVLT